MLATVLQGFFPMYKHMHSNCRFLLTEAVKLFLFCSLTVAPTNVIWIYALSLSMLI